MKYLVLLFLTSLGFSLGASSMHFQGQEGVIIILNGPSSVGKTSIQKALQKSSKETFIRIGIDTFFDALIETPDLSKFQEEKKFDQYTSSGEYIRGIALLEDEKGYPIVPLYVGPAGDRIIYGMHRSIGEYAKVGNNIVVDYILYKPEWLDDLEDSLKGRNVYFVRVNAPLSIIEERERARQTSPVGHSRSHYDTVHLGVVYDLEIDTSKMTPEESAHLILDHIQNHKAKFAH